MSETDTDRHRDLDRLALAALRIRRCPELRDRDPGADPLPGWTAVAGFLLALKGPAERAVRTARGSGSTGGPVGR